MVRRLLQLMGLATLANILYHGSGWGFIAMFWWTDRYLPVSVPNFDQLGSPAYYVLRVIEQLIIFAIPAYVFVTGFFVAAAAGRSRTTVGWKLVWSRVRDLMIPYLIWSAVTFAMWYLIDGKAQTVVEYVWMLVTGKAADPYYYVILVCQLYLLSPLIVPLARERWKLLLVVTALIQFGARTAHYMTVLGFEAPLVRVVYTFTPNWFFPRRILWFALGVVVGFRISSFKVWLGRSKWVLLAVLVVALPLGVLEWEAVLHSSDQEWLAPVTTLLDNVYAAAFIGCLLAFEGISIPFARQIGNLGTKAYGVFLLHSQVLALTAKTLYHIAPWVLGCQALFQPILYAAGLGVPLLLMAAVDRSPLRGAYRYLFG